MPSSSTMWKVELTVRAVRADSDPCCTIKIKMLKTHDYDDRTGTDKSEPIMEPFLLPPIDVLANNA